MCFNSLFIIIVGMNNCWHCIFHHLPVERHLGCLLFGTITNKTEIEPPHKRPVIDICFCFGKIYIKIKWLDYIEGIHLHIYWTVKLLFIMKPSSSKSSPMHDNIRLLNFIYSNIHVSVFHCVLIYLTLICIFWFCTFSLVDYLFKYFGHVYYYVFVLLCWVLIVIYLLGIKILENIKFHI